VGGGADGGCGVFGRYWGQFEDGEEGWDADGEGCAGEDGGGCEGVGDDYWVVVGGWEGEVVRVVLTLRC
jgi:hypothetical protein